VSARREVRTLAMGLEVRGSGRSKSIRGHAAVFDSEADIGPFRELIKPGAFADAIATDDVRALFNHDSNHVLGRTTSGTLRLSEDATGLLADTRPPKTTTASDLMLSIERGDVSQMSFSFQVLEADEEWKEDGGKPLRIINRIDRLWDISPVTFPAYEGTDVGVRAEQRVATRAIQKARAICKRRNGGNTGCSVSLARRKLQVVQARAREAPAPARPQPAPRRRRPTPLGKKATRQSIRRVRDAAYFVQPGAATAWRDLQKTSIHEAGHALAGLLLGNRISGIELYMHPRTSSPGWSEYKRSSGDVRFGRDTVLCPQILVAGFSAAVQSGFTHRQSLDGCTGDFEQIERNAGPPSPEWKVWTEETHELLKPYMYIAEALARRLLETGSLTGDEVHRFAYRHGDHRFRKILDDHGRHAA
jgi:HK97 family phage prohead protease